MFVPPLQKIIRNSGFRSDCCPNRGDGGEPLSLGATATSAPGNSSEENDGSAAHGSVGRNPSLPWSPSQVRRSVYGLETLIGRRIRRRQHSHFDPCFLPERRHHVYTRVSTDEKKRPFRIYSVTRNPSNRVPNHWGQQLAGSH